MSHKKLDFSSPSKLSFSGEKDDSSLGIISNKNSTVIKSFRLRKTDIEKIRNINNRVNEKNEMSLYNDSDIIRGAIYYLCIQDTETIKESIQRNK
ncbi:hypothetical protein FACS1894122_07320 [Alphaproteobacteria bacterium]|nr:hypothetical protein FACS1894122_07320 [Alphaproteobacteria bacterium]